MVLPAEDFRGHVAGSSTGVVAVVGTIISGNPEICDASVSILIENYIFRFDVSVNYLLLMQIL
jgi:hypothetical protein